MPELLKGQLIEAEHLNRYLWVAQFLPAGYVLDAACGVAYGSAMLGRTGRHRVLGVDRAGEMLNAVRHQMPPGVQLERADIASLPCDPETFDSIVCFETIEHLEDPRLVLNELRRVLKPGGLLVLSTPNRATEVPGNPHHLHSFELEELREELTSRFRHVRLFYQAAWITAAILDDESLEAEGPLPATARLTKVASREPSAAAYIVALASDVPLPEPPLHLVLNSPVELRRWMELWREQDELIRRQLEYIAKIEVRVEEHRRFRAQLVESEQLASSLPQLRRALADAADARDEARRRGETLAAELAAQTKRVQDLETSTSWRVTKPMRKVSQALLRLRAMWDRL